MASAEVVLHQHAVAHQILRNAPHVCDHGLEEVVLLFLVVVMIRIVPNKVYRGGKILLIHFFAPQETSAHAANHFEHASYILVFLDHEDDALVHAFALNS